MGDRFIPRSEYEEAQQARDRWYHARRRRSRRLMEDAVDWTMKALAVVFLAAGVGFAGLFILAALGLFS